MAEPAAMDDAEGGIVSPCTRICRLGEDDICLGCLRSIDEIAVWSRASQEQKAAILERCDLRRMQRQDAEQDLPLPPA